MTWTGTLADWMRDGPRLVREGVTQVDIVDKWPRRILCEGRYSDGFWLFSRLRKNAKRRGEHYEIPAAIEEAGLGSAEAELLVASALHGSHYSLSMSLSALSEACIAWAKEQQP